MGSTVANSISAVVGPDLGSTFGLVVTVVLLLLLVQRELVTAGGRRLQPIGQYLGLTIWPLLVLFGLIVVSRLTAAL